MKAKFVLLILILAPNALFAQMFSVGGDSEPTQSASSSFLSVGYNPVEFTYKGKPGIVLEENRLDFKSPAFYVGLENSGLNASLSFINKLTGAKNERYLNLSLDYINKFAFINSSSFRMGIPLGLMSNLVSIQNEEQNDDFSQTVFGFGLGAFTSITIAEKLLVSIEGLPSYGFSTSSGGLFGGSNKSLVASAKLVILNILPGRSLSLGYDYKYSTYDLDDNDFDYDLTHHLITLGVSL